MWPLGLVIYLYIHARLWNIEVSLFPVDIKVNNKFLVYDILVCVNLD